MSNLKSKLLVMLVGVAVMLTSYTSTVSADAFEGLSMMRMGAWEVDFSGNANAFVVTGDCDPDDEGKVVAGGLACGSNGKDYDYGDIRTGLLPSWFNFSASTPAPGGWKTGIHLSFQPGADDGASDLNGGSIGGPLGLNSANFRQIFTTLSHPDYGTFKIGRDLGVFGSNAILEDMTLLGVGGTARDLGAGGNSTLGRIGFGYIYADWKAQLQYTTPNMGGLSATFALVDPWGASSLAGTTTNTTDGMADPEECSIPMVNDSRTQCNDTTVAYSATHTSAGGQEGDTYGFEGKVNFAFDGGAGVSGHLWARFAFQEVDWENSDALTHGDADVEAYDIGGKLVMGDVDLVAYYYDGEGIGTTDYLIDGIDATGDERDSDGYYVQARWRTPMGTLLGISYGESELDETSYDKAMLADPNVSDYALVESNELFVIGAYHPIGEGLNLVVEYSNIESEAHNGNGSEEDSFAVGAIMFF